MHACMYIDKYTKNVRNMYEYMYTVPCMGVLTASQAHVHFSRTLRPPSWRLDLRLPQHLVGLRKVSNEAQAEKSWAARVQGNRKSDPNTEMPAAVC